VTGSSHLDEGGLEMVNIRMTVLGRSWRAWGRPETMQSRNKWQQNSRGQLANPG